MGSFETLLTTRHALRLRLCLKACIPFMNITWLVGWLTITILRSEIISKLFCPPNRGTALLGIRISSGDRASLLRVDSVSQLLCSTSSSGYPSLLRLYPELDILPFCSSSLDLSNFFFSLSTTRSWITLPWIINDNHSLLTLTLLFIGVRNKSSCKQVQYSLYSGTVAFVSLLVTSQAFIG